MRVRYAFVQYPYGAWAWLCVFCAMLCDCVLPTGRGVRPKFILELVRYIFRVCTCGTVFGLDNLSSVSCMCMYVRRSACAARALYHSREYVCACVVQYMTWAAWAACVVYMTARACTYVLCLYHLHSVLAWTAGAMHRFRKPATCTGLHRLCLGLRAWARTLYLYTYSCTDCAQARVFGLARCTRTRTVLWHGQPGQCTFRARVHELARCTCTRTAFGMDSRGDAPIARWSSCLDSHAVLVELPVQYLAWIA